MYTKSGRFEFQGKPDFRMVATITQTGCVDHRSKFLDFSMIVIVLCKGSVDYRLKFLILAQLLQDYIELLQCHIVRYNNFIKNARFQDCSIFLKVSCVLTWKEKAHVKWLY